MERVLAMVWRLIPLVLDPFSPVLKSNATVMNRVMTRLYIARKLRAAPFIVIPIPLGLVMVPIFTFPIPMDRTIIHFCPSHANLETVSSGNMSAGMSRMLLLVKG